VVIVLIICICIFSYTNIKKSLIKVSGEDISAILQNSSRSREIAKLYSDINILKLSFLGKNSFLKSEGLRLNKILDEIILTTDDRRLNAIQIELLARFNSYLDQCSALNILYFDRENRHNSLFNLMETLEASIGSELIRQTLEGKDTTFIEQLLMLVIGYKESLLSIDRLYTNLASLEYSSNHIKKRHSLMNTIQDLILRLQTITASVPDVAENGKKIIFEMEKYKEIVNNYNSQFDIVYRHSQKLNSSQTKLLSQMDVLDNSISESIQNLSTKMQITILTSIIATLLLTIVVVVSLGVIIMFFFRSMNNEIKERKLAQIALKENEIRYRYLYKHAPTGMYEIDFNTMKFTSVNQIMCAYTGYTEEEFLSMDPLNLLTEESKNIFFKRVESFYAGKDVFDDVEYTVIKKNGHHINAILKTDFIYEKGKVKGAQVVAHDITDLKKAEMETIKAQKIIAEQKKLALVGQIAGKMAHDFNNILGIIMGNVEIALQDCKDLRLKKVLDLVFTQTLRGKNIIKNLVVFAKDQEPKQEFFKVREKVDMVLSLLKKDLEQINLIKEVKSGLPDLLADPGMIEHALVNVIQNAIHAVSLIKNPKIIVRTNCQKGYFHFEIEDNGCGIPKEHLKSIYEPSFTLKGTKDLTGSYQNTIKGTGYGLSNVKKYIDQHNGIIKVDSTPGSGTRFILSLPIIRKKLTPYEVNEFSDSDIKKGKSILLVEDEESIADVQYEILTQEPFNHNVDIAPNGRDAINMFDRNNYDLVSLDYLLPGIENGMDVYNYIRKENESIPVLFISGNIEFLESIKDLQQKDLYVMHLSKPCQNKTYLDSINKLFDKGSEMKK